MQTKKYLSAEVECLKGLALTYSEFINNVCTRQINSINDNYYASSNLQDWNEDIGYLLYDGTLEDLDLSETKYITKDDFESMWKKSIDGVNLTEFIKYEQGDATNPLSERTLILHIVNNVGKWGKGFVLSLSKKYPKAKENYVNWFNKGTDFELGNVNFFSADENVVIANMLAQNGVKRNANDLSQKLDYKALENCLNQVADYALLHRLNIQAPKFGAGLGGGDWDAIVKIIEKTLSYKKIKCTILTI
ncbi:macro domain-containing protein [Capnocytophaga sp.]|uniref:macro domain-containing protein n=1 Tax=Capnocytophaga sp. TaxID=44737 RepID=UPI0026DB1A62|nr:macro domain-containing protein [Capnocytophaga sp.]MDO5106082.1 macro domain-containing protein [Capnocytophaga sp.]